MGISFVGTLWDSLGQEGFACTAILRNPRGENLEKAGGKTAPRPGKSVSVPLGNFRM
jgi:hypothetical protein